MATSAKVRVDVSKAGITCSICKTVYKDPRILPCGHMFCLECLQNELKTVEELKCKVCEKNWPSVSLKDLPEIRGLKEITNSQRKAAKKTCPKHADQNIMLHCKTCNELACAICKIDNHDRHACIDINAAVKDFDSIISYDLKRHENDLRKLEEEMEEFEKKMASLKATISTKKKTIMSYKESLSTNVSYENKKIVADRIRRTKIAKAKHFTTFSDPSDLQDSKQE